MSAAAADAKRGARGRPPRKRMAPEERRAQLLECALRVFARRGLGRAAHAEIAKEAGVAVSTVFLYFPSRESLVDSVLDEVERFYIAMATACHARTEMPAREVLRHHGSVFLDSLETHPDHTRVLLDWSTAFRDGVWPRYTAFVDALVQNHLATLRRGQVEGTIRSDLDIDTAARVHIASANLLLSLRIRGMGPEQLRVPARSFLAAALGELALDPPAEPAGA